VLLLSLLLVGCREELYTRLEEKEAVEMLSLLRAAGIQARKEPGQEDAWKLSIEAAELPRAVDLLKAAGLPREKHLGMGELYKEKGLISSPREEQARYIHGLSESLSATISTCVDNVLSARVHLVIPDAAPMGGKVAVSSAAVVIKYSGSNENSENLPFDTMQIRTIVKNAVEGISLANISVSCFPAANPFPKPPIPNANMEPRFDPFWVALGAASFALVALVICILTWFRGSHGKSPGMDSTALVGSPKQEQTESSLPLIQVETS